MTITRITLSRAKGWRKPEGAIVVSRPTIWGNPWQPGPCGVLHWPMSEEPNWLSIVPFTFGGEPAMVDAETCVRWFSDWLSTDYAPLPESLPRSASKKVGDNLTARRTLILSRLPELRGHDLCCWCRPGEPCHATVLIRMANG